MRKIIILSGLLILPIGVLAQRVTTGSIARIVPIFKDVKDSILYVDLNNLIRTKKWGSTKQDHNRLDSLLKELTKLNKRATGNRTVYYPRFKLLDSLKGKNEIKYVTELTILNLKADKLPATLFECENLERLELVNTSINIIQGEVSKLKELKTLEIYNNRPAKQLWFDKNNTIKKLIIRGDKPEQIPSNYSNLKSLEVLDLCKNNLTRFPVIKNNSKLYEILLVENSIDRVIVKGRKLPSIKKIDIRYNKIKKLDGSIGKIKSLQTLFLNYNEIHKVKSGVGRLKNLEYLSLYENQLEEIPKSFYKFGSLINLDVYYNNIQHISSMVTQWKNLMILHIANNRIYDLPENIGDLKNLQELYAYNNRLSILPNSLSKLTDLKVLRINDNYLDSFPEQTFSMPKLQQLDISQNRISSLPLAAFQFTEMQLLGLKNNPWNGETKALIAMESKKLKERQIVVLIDNEND